MIGQALFLVVLTVLILGLTTWASNDLEVRHELSEVAELSIKLLTFLTVGVFVLATVTSAWAAGVPLVARLLVGATLAVWGLASVVLAGRRTVPDGGHLLRDPVPEGVLVLTLAAAVVSDSVVSLLLVLLAGWATRRLARAAQVAGDHSPDPSTRWMPVSPAGSGSDGD